MRLLNSRVCARPSGRSRSFMGIRSIQTLGVPVVLAGDYNVVSTPQDIYQTRSLDNNALVQPQSREAFARLLNQDETWL